MIQFSKQRWLGLVLFLLCSVAIVALYWRYAGLVPHIAYLSGWALLAVILLLTIYNGRKKIPFLPMFSSETWLQFHIYAGLLTGVMFVVHISFKIPTGWFEGTLAWLYTLVMLSGFFGLFVSRAIPKRLTTRGGEVLFERIPAIRRGLQEQTEELALKSVGEVKSVTIAEFYLRELKDFFEGPKNLYWHLLEVSSPVNGLLNKINDVNRYLNPLERETMNKIAGFVRQKDGLDYHFALQRMLKLWLFVHIPLTYGLLVFTVAHVILVFAFSGGVK
jgi:hypothetical protein